uniref:Uncharacterized protein n=1 Tax=Moniliophthora roreri TaxID=221103 RepID=A0A0W0F285_MONRR
MSGINAQTGAPKPPSETVEPTRSDTVPQQGSTQPGDGSTVHEGQPQRVVEAPAEQPHLSFKEQASPRGTVLNKPELKEHGQQVLEGRAPATKPGHE